MFDLAIVIQALIVAVVTAIATALTTGYVNGKIMEANLKDLRERIERIENYLNGLLKDKHK